MKKSLLLRFLSTHFFWLYCSMCIASVAYAQVSPRTCQTNIERISFCNANGCTFEAIGLRLPCEDTFILNTHRFLDQVSEVQAEQKAIEFESKDLISRNPIAKDDEKSTSKSSKKKWLFIGSGIAAAGIITAIVLGGR